MEQYIYIPLLRKNIQHLQKHVCVVIPALLRQMEKFQLSVGLNNGWLCNAVAEIPVDPAEKTQQNAARNFHFKQIKNDSSGSEGPRHPFCILCKRTRFVCVKLVSVVSHINVDFLFFKNWIYGRSQGDTERWEKNAVDKAKETIEGEIYPMSHNLDLIKTHQPIPWLSMVRHTSSPLSLLLPWQEPHDGFSLHWWRRRRRNESFRKLNTCVQVTWLQGDWLIDVLEKKMGKEEERREEENRNPGLPQCQTRTVPTLRRNPRWRDTDCPSYCSIKSRLQ